jgi:hypothetical protein
MDEKKMMDSFARATANAYLIQMKNSFDDLAKEAPKKVAGANPLEWELFVSSYQSRMTQIGQMITSVAAGKKAAKILVNMIAQLKECLAMRQTHILPEYLQWCILQVSIAYDFAMLEAFGRHFDLQEKVTLKAAGMNTLLDEHVIDTISNAAKAGKVGKKDAFD